MLMSHILNTLKKWPAKQIASVRSSRLHTSVPLSVKELVERKEGKQTIVEGRTLKSGREEHLIKTEHDAYACPVCRLNLDIKHTDVLILSQFVRQDGCMLPRRITGLCNRAQKRMSSLVSMAHIAGLMPNLVPKYSKKDCFKKRRDWKKYNTYFDESTITTFDVFRNDKYGIKERFYESLGLKFDKEPWKKRPVLDVATRKIVYYY